MHIDTKHCVICGEDRIPGELFCDDRECFYSFKDLVRQGKPGWSKEILEKAIMEYESKIPPKMLLENAISTEQ